MIDIWQLPSPVIDLIIANIDLKELKALLSASHAMNNVFDANLAWREFVVSHYGPESILISNEYKTLARQLSIARTGSIDMDFTCDSENCWETRLESTSPFGTTAHLTNPTTSFEASVMVPSVPGTYDIIWRINCPTKLSTDFSGRWTATVMDNSGNAVAYQEYKHCQPAGFLVPYWAFGWLQINFGRIKVPENVNFVMLNLMAVDKNRSSKGLQIDWAELRPVALNSKPMEVPHVFQEIPKPPVLPIERQRECLTTGRKPGKH